MFVIAFLDSSFLPLPVVNDILIVWLSWNAEAWYLWLFYATMATLGSVLGCLVIYFIGRKGGEVLLRERIKAGQLGRIHDWLEQNEFLAVAIPSFLPPPTPFKLFVLAAGGFQVRLRYFVMALLVGRGSRYFLLGFLGYYFGQQFMAYLSAHFIKVSLIAAGLILVGYLLVRVAGRRSAQGASAK